VKPAFSIPFFGFERSNRYSRSSKGRWKNPFFKGKRNPLRLIHNEIILKPLIAKYKTNPTKMMYISNFLWV
jgi:hypothetical protein